MKNKRTILVSMTVLSLMAIQSKAAEVQSYEQDQTARHESHQNVNYRFAKVIDVKPIVEIVREQEPRKVCKESVSYHRNRHHHAKPAVGTIIGAIVGSSLSRKRDKKIVGAIAGAAIGHEIGKASQHHGGGYREVTHQRCRTYYDEVEYERVSGYRVTYRDQKKNHTVEMPYDPGKEIKLKVEVSPIIDNDHPL